MAISTKVITQCTNRPEWFLTEETLPKVACLSFKIDAVDQYSVALFSAFVASVTVRWLDVSSPRSRSPVLCLLNVVRC